MQRRLLLQVGLGGTAVLAVGGGLLATVRPGWRDGHLSGEGRDLFAAVSRAVVPALEGADRDAMAGHLSGIEAVIAGLPPSTRSELSDLLALLCSAPGRWAFAGLRPPWRDASVADTASTLEAMRRSGIQLRAQAYQALRELALAAHYGGPATWAQLGYPGPVTVG
jgi:hypothetical protein